MNNLPIQQFGDRSFNLMGLGANDGYIFYDLQNINSINNCLFGSFERVSGGIKSAFWSGPLNELRHLIEHMD
jgi:hypothetical protein